MDLGRGSAPGEGVPARPGDATQSQDRSDPVDEGVHLEASALALLDAFSTISSELDTRSVLLRVVTSACRLTGAQSGALGIIGHDGRLSDFVTHGMDQG